jgi:hypothetical protein
LRPPLQDNSSAQDEGGLQSVKIQDMIRQYSRDVVTKV